MEKGATPELPFSKIMLSKDEGLIRNWGSEKQQRWGELTAQAIIIASEKLQAGDFNTVREAFNFLAKMRQVIGTILDHDKDVGELRNDTAFTEISNDPKSTYSTIFPEFHSWLEISKRNSGASENLTLAGEYQDRAYIRNSFFGKGPYEVAHNFNEEDDPRYQQAESHFNALKDTTLTAAEKQEHINTIFFYLTDIMPCARGSAAVSQMLHYALQATYIGDITYLGKLSSKYGHSQGVTPDLAAMLSPTLDDFLSYMTEHVIDETVTVEKLSDAKAEITLPKDVTTLKKSLDKKISDLEKAIPAFDNFHTQVGDMRKQAAETILNRLKILKEIVVKNDDNNTILSCVAHYQEELVNHFFREKAHYGTFYEGLKDKSGWPPALPLQYHNVPTEGDYRVNSRALMGLLYDYSQNLGRRMGWRQTYHTAASYNARNLLWASADYQAKGKHQSEPLEQYLAIIETECSSSEKIRKVINDFVELIHYFDEGKTAGTSREDLIKQKMDEILNEAKDTNKNYIDENRKILERIYDNLEDQKQNLKTLAPFYETLHLSSSHAAQYLLGEEPRRRMRP